ncbi:hypothetical protein JL720_2670 [Aureococcus anophagefferens]|nr:hypothetical protein JL720_2670 [Aureococcus anophagefferens]
MPKKYKVKLDAVVGRYDELNVWRSRALAAEQRLSARQRSSPWRGSPCPSVDSWRERAVAAEQAERFPDSVWHDVDSARRRPDEWPARPDARRWPDARRAPRRRPGPRRRRRRRPRSCRRSRRRRAPRRRRRRPPCRGGGPRPPPPPPSIERRRARALEAPVERAPPPSARARGARRGARERARAQAPSELEAELEGLGADLAAIRAAARPPPPEKTAPAPPASARSPGEDAWAALIETGAAPDAPAPAPEPDHHRVHAKHTGHATGLHRRR